jgi:hypothetical protein
MTLLHGGLLISHIIFYGVPFDILLHIVLKKLIGIAVISNIVISNIITTILTVPFLIHIFKITEFIITSSYCRPKIDFQCIENSYSLGQLALIRAKVEAS